jgi:hypothetical protein
VQPGHLPMTNLSEHDLGSDGVAYLRKYLNWGGLAEKALTLLLSHGRTFALLPQGTSLERARKFDVGGLSITSASKSYLARRFLGCPPANCEGTLIVQDTVAQANDLNISKSNEDKFFYENRIYYFLNAADFSEQSIADVIRGSRGFWVVGFLVACRVNREGILDQEVGEPTFADLANNIREVFVSAYDGESFVMWVPDPSV